MKEFIDLGIRFRSTPIVDNDFTILRDEFDNALSRMSKLPKIVCLCGTTREPEAFIKANKDETLKGNIVLSVGMYGHIENIDMSGPTKRMLDDLHKRKIDLADEVLVVTKHIGESTQSEIDYAKSINKTIRYL